MMNEENQSVDEGQEDPAATEADESQEDSVEESNENSVND